MNPVAGSTDVSPGQEPTKEVKTTEKSPLLKFKFPKLAAVALPVGIILAILLVGAGGTYFAATMLFSPKSSSKIASNGTLENKSVNLPSPTITPTFAPSPSATPSPTLYLTPTPVSSGSAGWTSYYFSGGNLSFQYPPGWFVDLADTSGAPYLHVQNFQPTGKLPVNPQKQYAFLIERFEQVGIASVSGLLNALANKASSPVLLEGVNMGTATVLSGGAKTVNGYSAYERTVSYSNFPTSQYYELYVLDGKSIVVRFLPELDTASGISYFNTLLGTVLFK